MLGFFYFFSKVYAGKVDANELNACTDCSLSLVRVVSLGISEHMYFGYRNGIRD